MKNLFKRVYFKHDNNLAPSAGQNRVIITERELQFPITEDQATRERVGILNYFKSFEELNESYGDREAFWATMMARTDKVVIIASPNFAAELLVQYWKSIFENSTADSLFTLYQFFINSENLLSYREKERAIAESDANVHCRQSAGVSIELFRMIFDRVPVSASLQALTKNDLPVEYLLMGVLGETLTKGSQAVAYRKIRDIVSVNIARCLVNAKEDFFSETHNFYLLNEAGQTETITDPIAFIGKHPDLKWVLDTEFVYGNEDAILKKYSLNDFLRFFQTYSKLFRFQYDEELATNYLINNDYRGLLDYDIADEKGNFFGVDNFVNKINGLLISHLYQLKRQGDLAALAQYKLR